MRRWIILKMNFTLIKPSTVVNHLPYMRSTGGELDWSSDVRTRIQESSYIQEQYVLTRCSLSSERSLPAHAQASSSSDATCLPDPMPSAPLLDTGSLPQGLEKIPGPEPRSSLSRWADSAWQQNLSADNSRKNVNIFSCECYVMRHMGL